MSWQTINDILAGKSEAVQVGQTVTVKVGIRSKRDSKAGISFLVVSDGLLFCHDSVRCSERTRKLHERYRRVNTGCSVEVDGEVVKSPGKGQSVEIKATAVRVVGFVDDPESYPVSNKRHSLSIFGRSPTCGPAPTLLRRSPAFAIPSRSLCTDTFMTEVTCGFTRLS